MQRIKLSTKTLSCTASIFSILLSFSAVVNAQTSQSGVVNEKYFEICRLKCNQRLRRRFPIAR